MNSMLVSVIMPCYNSQQYIADSINSVLEQTYKNFELLVVDNMSTDDSTSVVDNFVKTDSRVKLLRCDRKGAAEARNYGIKQANGRFIAFLDSDDLWEENKLEVHIHYMIENGVKLTCSAYRIISENGYHLTTFNIQETKLSKESLLRTCSVGCLTVVFDLDGINSTSRPLMPNIAKEDYAYWFVLLNYFKEPFRVIPRVLASYRVHKNGISSKKYLEIMRQWNVYRNFLGLSFMQSLKYIFCYALNGIKKTYL